MAKNCGNCRFFSIFFCSGQCTNPNSRFVNQFVGRSNFCLQHKNKENTNEEKKSRGGT